MISADDAPPCDRPNLSKDFLAGTAPDDWIPLRTPEYYAERGIELLLNARVSSIDVHRNRVQLENGKQIAYGALLIATGAEPVRLNIPGAADSQIFYLRTFADSRAIVAKAASAKRAVVVGASFIGLEVAASLRARGLDVHVVGPESAPLERVLGPTVGRFVQEIHESHGVAFHLGRTVSRIDGNRVTLSDGTTLDADFVVLGVGVRPSTALAEQAGLAIDRGITVDEYLQTSARGVFAAGDVARWPDPHSGDRIRIEHWVVAERQGQVAARNILGQRQRFDAVPFFWSQHYDVTINYVGHAEKWDVVAIDGTLAAHDCAVTLQARRSHSRRGDDLARPPESASGARIRGGAPLRRCLDCEVAGRGKSGGGVVSAEFAGQVVVVAGGTGGLGRAVSQAFLDEGATVIVTYRTQAEFDALVQAAGAKPPTAPRPAGRCHR